MKQKKIIILLVMVEIFSRKIYKNITGINIYIYLLKFNNTLTTNKTNYFIIYKK